MVEARGLSGCGARGLVAPRHVGSSPTRGRASVPCITVDSTTGPPGKPLPVVLKIRYKALNEEKRLQLDSEGSGYYWALKIDTAGRGRRRKAGSPVHGVPHHLGSQLESCWLSTSSQLESHPPIRRLSSSYPNLFINDLPKRMAVSLQVHCISIRKMAWFLFVYFFLNSPRHMRKLFW